MGPARARRWTYPAIGLLLASGAPGGLLVIRAFASSQPPTPLWALGDLVAELPTYLYVTLSTAIAYVVLGWVLGRKEDRLEQRSTTDDLTGLANRRYLDERVDQELARTRRGAKPPALLMIDVDRLKEINDTRGHSGGDRALVQVADAIRAACRVTDVAARYGGDEFALLLPATDSDEAVVLGERIRAALRRASPPSPSVSIGVAGPTDPACEVADLYRVADAALYRAKKSGRDRVVAAAG